MLQHLRCLALLLALTLAPSFASAELVRFRFVPINACGATGQVPVGPEGAMGELKRGLAGRTFPYAHVVRPTQMVTFRHPFNGRNITVPLRLPTDTARMEHLSDRIVYNYPDLTVEVRFLADGSVDVVYNSGLLRSLRLD